MTTNLIQAENIQVSLGKHEILKRASLQLNSGELVGLIGPNGAGKSTLIRVLAGILKHDGGSLKVLGESIHSLENKKLAKQLAYLPQSREIHWPLSVKRVVELGRIPHLQPWQEVGESDQIILERVMAQVDVTHLANRTVDHLAGGERALVMLARALAVEPEILLADEPVAGLDPNHQIQVMQLLKDFASQGKGSVVVLHDLSLAARFCDKLFLIHEGKMLSSGSPEEVLSKENLEESYGIEVKVVREEDGFYVIPWRRIK